MSWSHQVNPEWLAERKKYVTASDIRDLLPFTATGRARTNLEEAYMKVWAEKRTIITADDICSSGVMARGHLLEPYAIDAFNKLEVAPKLYHWDDALVYSSDSVSCSPDALSLAQPTNLGVSLPGDTLRSVAMGEVKSYGSAGHYQYGAFTDKLELKERWQVATAFYTIPSLEKGILIFFNPLADHPLFYHQYDRADLDTELTWIKTITDDYWSKAADFEVDASIACPAAQSAVCPEEAAIIAELLDLEAQANGCSVNP